LESTLINGLSAQRSNNSVIEEIKVAEKKMWYVCFCIDTGDLLQDRKKEPPGKAARCCREQAALLCNNHVQPTFA